MWIDDLIREAEKSVDEVEVFWVEGESVSVDLRKRMVHLATTTRDCGLGIRTILGGRIGSSSTNNPEEWKSCLAAAVASGRLATPQEWGGLPQPAPVYLAPLASDPSLAVTPDTAQVLLDRLLAGAGEHDAEVTAGSAGVSRTRVLLANSHGLRYTDEHTGVSVSLEAIKGQSTGYEFDHSWELDRIDPEHVGEQATFFAQGSAEATDIPTGDYDLILSPLALGEVLGNVIIPSLNGRSVHAGRSRFAGMLGQQVATPAVSLYDDPLLPGACGSTRWDAEGTPTRRVDYVADGILKCFAYDLKTAYRYGTKSTGNASRGGYGGLPGIGHHNFVLDGARDRINDERALFIHNIVGAHTANPLSGEFSVELSNAFFMDGGEFREPVRSAMLSGNAFEFLHAIAGLSRDTRTIGSMILPSVRINKQRIIGK